MILDALPLVHSTDLHPMFTPVLFALGDFKKQSSLDVLPFPVLFELLSILYGCNSHFSLIVNAHVSFSTCACWINSELNWLTVKSHVSGFSFSSVHIFLGLENHRANILRLGSALIRFRFSYRKLLEPPFRKRTMFECDWCYLYMMCRHWNHFRYYNTIVCLQVWTHFCKLLWSF